MSAISSETNTSAARTKKGAAKRLTIARRFTTEGQHPYDTINWTFRDIEQKDWRTDTTIFSQRGVEFPDFWSDNAATIATTKYFRGALDSEGRESSLRELIDRVVTTYVTAGKAHKYFATAADARIFSDELTWLLAHQYFAFNSPVWFNVGTSSPQQVSACFILAVDDTMDAILNWYREEGLIFKGGSGAGLNLSKIRSSKELLSSGGYASGPVSFMRGADASAGTIKSGGATRRAAKMVVLDVDHPDIADFVATKVREEDKIRALRDAGYDMDLGGEDIVSVQYQNANNSVRVSDEFMRAVESGGDFALTSRATGDIIDTVNAAELFGDICQAAWACADPGLQYGDTINDWHTNAQTGPITASNPCSEYLSLDNSSCNLASLNLMKFLSDDNSFNVDDFTNVVELVTTAMDISICFADFPTEEIGKTTRDFRQLGVGYSNLGALLMTIGLPYDSDEGRNVAAAITDVMTAAAYKRSADLAGVVGAYAGFRKNLVSHTRVMAKHEQAHKALRAFTPIAERLVRKADDLWSAGIAAGEKSGWRNAQASLLAPTGTIGLFMDCDTTGIEPDFSLVKNKKLVGGGYMKFVNQTVGRAMTSLGYQDETINDAIAYISEHNTIVGAPGVRAGDSAVFATAVGDNAIAPAGHILMMAAVQPFLSGAISKTVNLPEDATVADIADTYMQGWKLGLKAIAIYRDNCKVGQPLSTKPATNTAVDAVAPPEPVRRRLPQTRSSQTIKFSIGDVEGYLTTGEYEDGSMGEMFIRVSKQGSTLSGIMDGLAMSVSVGLQYGVPLETYIAKYINSQFDPSGMTNDKDVRIAKSMLDYLFRKLALMYLPEDTRHAYGIYTTAERTAAVESGSYDAPVAALEAPGTPAVPTPDVKLDVPLCTVCGVSTFMVRSGSCFLCGSCGSSSGCS